MTNPKQTPAEILTALYLHLDLNTLPETMRVASPSFDVQSALTALDDYYREYYLAMLPEKKLYNIEHMTEFEISELNGFNRALSGIRHRMEEK